MNTKADIKKFYQQRRIQRMIGVAILEQMMLQDISIQQLCDKANTHIGRLNMVLLGQCAELSMGELGLISEALNCEFQINLVQIGEDGSGLLPRVKTNQGKRK